MVIPSEKTPQTENKIIRINETGLCDRLIYYTSMTLPFYEITYINFLNSSFIIISMAFGITISHNLCLFMLLTSRSRLVFFFLSELKTES